MTTQATNMDHAIANAESIGTIGSPSTTTEIKIDIRGTAAENKIVGEYAILRYRQQNDKHYALGQITEVRLRNRMLEDHTILTLARARGAVDHVSDHQDTHEGDLRISAAYRETPNGYQESSLGTVPPTGTDVKKATNDAIDTIIQNHKNNVFYLGTAYQSDLDLPMWFRQFNGAPGQLAEAHHLGIFGRSGSGKSTLAKLILLAYATHPEMGILIVDPQGEFAKSFRGDPEGFAIDLPTRLREINRQVINVDVSNIVLSSWDLAEEMLAESSFMADIGVTTPSQTNPKGSAASAIIEALRANGTTLTNMHMQTEFDRAILAIENAANNRQIYSTAGPTNRIIAAIDPSRRTALYQNHWQPLMLLFNRNRNGAVPTDQVIRSLLSVGRPSRPIVNINLAPTAQNTVGVQWNDRIRNIIINQILGDLERAAERAYQGNQSLNTMVVIDEAQRLAPNRASDDADEYAKRIRTRLADAARTTRKYGLGWMFISQSLASISTDIVRQTRIQFFGHGLSMGSELNSLNELVGGDRHNISLYASFKDPESAFAAESREYSFMVAGPVSPLCLTATPVFLSVYNNPDTFLKKNAAKFPNAQLQPPPP